MRRFALFALPAAVLACTGAPKALVETGPAPAAVVPAPERPRPYPVTEPAGVRRAVERGTRTRTGVPGPSYWQQFARYQLDAELDPAQNRLTGRAVIRYTNNSPDTLRFLHLHLHQNLFAPTAIRNEEVPVTGGMTIDRAVMGGQVLERFERGPVRPGYAVQGTIMRVRPTANVLPGQTVELEFAWHFTVNPDGGPRGGQDAQVWYLAYWYPQMAVYDDVNGWQIDQYMGRSEFYMGYGDYDVALTVPEGWLIGSTGELVNAAEVLSPQTRQRLAEARGSRGVVAVVGEADRGAGRATQRGTNGKLTWRFQARSVRDFAFGTSDRYLWDATAAVVGDHNSDGIPDTANAFAFRRPEKRGWFLGARAVQYSVEFLSRFLWPYPWPTMTAVDGVNSCSGMEYPMITCIGGGNDSMDVWGTTLHETGHMWFPMMVGSDEKRFAWQDEGLTVYNTDIGSWEAGYRRGNDPTAGTRMGYVGFARTGQEVELMRHGDLYPGNSAAYGVASYPKMATNVASLRSLLGDSVFLRGYREYGRRWMYRHPTPDDFFNAFNDVSGRDLGWFWRTWWFETWTLDQAIARVRESGTAYVVEVEDRGLAPMPVRLVVTRADGRTESYEVPVERWLAGHRKAEVGVPEAATVTRIEIDPSGAFPDVDRSNNVWRRPAQ